MARGAHGRALLLLPALQPEEAQADDEQDCHRSAAEGEAVKD